MLALPGRQTPASIGQLRDGNDFEMALQFNRWLALHLLALQCMTISLNELAQCEDRLQAEIVERECLLAALRVLRSHAAKGQSLSSLELGVLASALLHRPQHTVVIESTATSDAVPAPELPQPAALPPPPPAPRYVHPDLSDWKFHGHGGDSEAVRWAIMRMTEDFSLTDVAALLKREGRPLKSSQISVVLTRLKSRRELEEIARSQGPIPAVFRRPGWALPLEEIIDQPDDSAAAESIPAAA